MAKVRLNILLDSVSGRIGDELVLKHTRGGQTILCRKPTFSEHRVFSPAQREHQERFREASAYARQAAKQELMYAEKAKKTGQPAYNVALADWFHTPEILGVDLEGWTGKAGEKVRIRARDDVQVKTVKVVIADAQGNQVEQGVATSAGGLWWEYVTTADCPTEHAQVVITAEDLPGHVAQATEEV